MSIGTKSILFGAHQFILHPIIVAIAWRKLYGFPWDPRLWILFFVHDLGYIGKPNMDGPEGEQHVLLGAKIMSIFGKFWHDMSLYHSRFYCRLNNKPPSKFCYADKLAIAITPTLPYVILCSLTGEIYEYMHKNPREVKGYGKSKSQWYNECKEFCIKWTYDNVLDKTKDNPPA